MKVFRKFWFFFKGIKLGDGRRSNVGVIFNIILKLSGLIYIIFIRLEIEYGVIKCVELEVTLFEFVV